MNKYWSAQEVMNAGKQKNPSKRLLTYLEDFRTDSLTTGSPERPDSYIAQREALVKVMKSLYSAQGLHLTVHASSVAIPNFWELLLTLHYLTHEIKLTGNMGYYRQQIGTGIYVANEQPYAEFTIVDAGLAKLLDSKDNDNSEKYKASLSLDQRSRKLILRIDGQRHLLKQYRSEKSINYHALLKLYTNTGEPQTRSDLMNPGANTTLNHLPSNIGFRGILREKFIEFGYINSLRALTLHKTIELNKEDYDRLKAELVKNQG